MRSPSPRRTSKPWPSSAERARTRHPIDRQLKGAQSNERRTGTDSSEPASRRRSSSSPLWPWGRPAGRRRRLPRRPRTPSSTGAASPKGRSPPAVRRPAAACSAASSTGRCTTPSPRSREASTRSRPVSPRLPGASADAAVAQAARDVLVARVPGQAAAVQAAYDAYMALDPRRARKGRGQGRRHGRRSRDARDAHRRPLRRRRSVRPADAGPGRLRADRADAARRRQARPCAAVHLRVAVRATGPAARSS